MQENTPGPDHWHTTVTHPSNPEYDVSTAYTDRMWAIEDAGTRREAQETGGYDITELREAGIVMGPVVHDLATGQVVEEVRVRSCTEAGCAPTGA